MEKPLSRNAGRCLALLFLLCGTFCLSGCPRKQTIHDDRPLEKRPHVETEEKIDRADPFRP